MNIWQWQAECSIVSSDPVHVLVRGVQMVMGCTMDDGPVVNFGLGINFHRRWRHEEETYVITVGGPRHDSR